MTWRTEEQVLAGRPRPADHAELALAAEQDERAHLAAYRRARRLPARAPRAGRPEQRR